MTRVFSRCFVSAILLALIWPAQAEAAVAKPPSTGWHLGASVFHISRMDDWKNDIGYGARLGYWFPSRDYGTRHGPQLDVTHFSLDGDQPGIISDIDLTAVLFSYQFEVLFIPTDPRWSLYAGGGGGVVRGKVTQVGFGSGSDTAGAAQLMAGFEFHPFPHFGLRAGYRHFWFDNLSDGAVNVNSDSASQIEVGVTIRF